MSDVPRFLVRPPFRCFQPVGNRPGRLCGELAAWMTDPADADRHGFYCGEHKRENDVPISNSAPFRRVSITLEVLFCGASFDNVEATQEALAVAERALEEVRGLVNLVTSHSEIGYWRPAVPLRMTIGGRGDH